ncbi:MAG: polysaccharide biosynthesis/export family protein [Candidatus Eisenbacteria bacterium]
MNPAVRNMLRPVIVFALPAVLLWAGAAVAEDYVLGPDDVIEVSVWLHRELERTVTIDGSGMITYPPLGEMQAAGLTPRQLGDRLAERLGGFLRQTVAVTVTVTQFMSRSVFVSGAVARPGRYGFERIPGLIDAISQAGGALPGADLSRVQVVRKEGETRRSIDADVASTLRDGVGVQLPELRPGDTIVVPGALAGVASAAGDGVGVLGEVNRPGLYPVGGGQDLWTVLAAAGGISPRGDLSNVNVITRQGAGQVILKVNLRDVLAHGTRAPFVLRSGDVVFVASTATTAAGKTWAVLQEVLGTSGDVLRLLLVRDVLTR